MIDKVYPRPLSHDPHHFWKMLADILHSDILELRPAFRAGVHIDLDAQLFTFGTDARKGPVFKRVLLGLVELQIVIQTDDLLRHKAGIITQGHFGWQKKTGEKILSFGAALTITALRIARPGLAELFTDIYAVEMLAADGLLGPKTGFIDQASAHAPLADMQMLTRILESPAACAAVLAKRFPFILFGRKPML